MWIGNRPSLRARKPPSKKLLSERDPEVRGAPFALAFSSPPFFGYGAVQELAKGIDAALAGLPVEDRPAALVFAQNVGRVVGGISSKWNLPCIDEINLSELDFIDVGEVVEGEGFVPVVVKSLAFGTVAVRLNGVWPYT